MSRLGRHGVVYGAGVLLNKGVAFIMLPIYTRFLTPSDYGLLQLVAMTLEVVSIFAGSRLATGVFRFYHKTDVAVEKNRVLTTALALMVGAYALAGALVWIYAQPIARLVFGGTEHVDLIHIGAASFAFQSLLVVPLSFLQVAERSTSYVMVNAGKLALQLTLNIVLVVGLRMGAKGVLLSGLVANIVIGSILVFIMLRSVGFGFSGGASKNLLRFGVPMIGTQMAGFVLTMGDRYFLQQEGSAAVVGLYGLAYQFGILLVTVGHSPFQTVWDPMRFEVAKRADRDDIYAQAFVYLNLLLITIGVGIALVVKDVLVIIADPAFHAAADLVPVILLAYVLYAWTKFHDLGIMVRERTEFVTLANWIAAGVALIGYVILIPWKLGFGAAWATVIAFAVREILTYSWSQRLWRVRYRWTPVVKMTLLAVAVYLVAIQLEVQSLWLSLAWRFLMFGVYAGGLWVIGVLSPSDKQKVLDALRSPKTTIARFAG